MLEPTVSFLKQLVAFNTDSSTKSNYLECAQFLHEEAQKRGLASEIILVPAADGLPRPNVLISRDVGAKETVLLLVHFDVVPAGSGWNQDPFTVVEKDGKLYGRGVADDKAGVACCFSAISLIKNPQYNLKLLATCDEEVGGEYGIQGVIKIRPDAVKSDICLVVDGGLDTFDIGCSGIIWGTITISGTGGHAAYDFKTGNLVHQSFSFLQEVSAYSAVRKKVFSKLDAPENPVSKKLFGRFNVTMLSAGTQPNVLPSEVKARFDLRLIPEEKAIDAQTPFKSFIDEVAKKHHLNVAVSFDTVEEGYSSLDSVHLKQFHETANQVMGKPLALVAEFGGIDGMHIAHHGIPTFNFGPGECDIHSIDEHIPKKNLEKTLDFLERVLSPPSK